MKKTNKSVDKKRHGLHHSKGRHYSRVYLPYLPAVLIFSLALLLSGIRIRPASNVMAFATDVSINGLLAATNSQRDLNNRSNLTINKALNDAAQAKANDMVARDYWSHITPDGKEPWIFIDGAGYKYLKAGENLAYGFSDSDSVVSGWMNSPSHKANLLDSEFSEVGFGFANSNNFNGDGKETVVVAMYGKPQVLSTSGQMDGAQPSPSQPDRQETGKSSATSKTAEAAVPNTENPVDQVTSNQAVTRIESLTNGNIPWATFAVGLVSGTAIAVMMINHGFRIRRLIRKGESIILHHPVLDVTMISLAVLGLVLAQNIGFIK